MTIEITGFAQVEENVKRVLQKLEPGEIENVLLEGANIIGQAAINNAPEGPTGNLKHSIIAKILTRKDATQPAPAIVAIDYRIGPHAHLVEFGHMTKTKKGMKFVPPHPFMRPAWDSNSEAVKEGITEEMNAIIEGAPST